MNPVLYRYRDSESVIKAMEGYTPGEGWTPLYDQAAVDAATAAERERCIDIIERYRVPVGNSCSGELAAEWTMDALWSIRDSIRKDEA